MIHNEEPMQQGIAKSSRLRAIFRPNHKAHDPIGPALKERASDWMDAHPWGVIGAVLGVAGVLGYSLGVRS
ncbi:MAG TPA: hypothetical protein VFO10_15630 [Oligoflexus sp.]|uniref:hypothetical protein n=1 Tax=Oligoflexus sp. TaxID=1971216 RepID=UPI002D803484|nr:hypothetical protein [Oligoflexus sp.]HET9238692.1 hypothetical protein [Oligoflexus sp.]